MMINRLLSILFIVFFLHNALAQDSRSRYSQTRLQKPMWCEDLGIQNCMLALGRNSDDLIALDSVNPSIFLAPEWAEHVRLCREDRRTNNFTQLQTRRTQFAASHHISDYLKSVIIVPTQEEQLAHLSLARPVRLVIDCAGAHIQISESVFSTRSRTNISDVFQSLHTLSAQIQAASQGFRQNPQSIVEAQYCSNCLTRQRRPRTRTPTINLQRVVWHAASGGTQVISGGDYSAPPINYITQSCIRSQATPQLAESRPRPEQSTAEIPEIEEFNNAVNVMFSTTAEDPNYWSTIQNQLNGNIATGYSNFTNNYDNYWSSDHNSPNYNRAQLRQMFREWDRSYRHWQRSREGQRFANSYRSYREDMRRNRTQTAFQDPTALAMQAQITAWVTRANNCLRDLCNCSKSGELKNAISDGMEMHAPLAMSYAFEAMEQIRATHDFENRCSPPAEDSTTPTSSSTPADDGGI